MKIFISYSIVLIVSLISGFFLAFFFMSKEMNKELDQVIIMQKLILIDQIADDLHKNLQENKPKTTLSIICEQLPYLKKEATDAGEPVSEIIDHIRYVELIIDKFKKLSTSTNSSDCLLMLSP